MKTPLFDQCPCVVRAEFLGFFRKENPETCTHVSCGFSSRVIVICPKCHWHTSLSRKTTCLNCNSQLVRCEPTGKVKCSRTRWRRLSIEELHTPNQEVRYGAVKLHLVDSFCRLKDGTFVIDLEEGKFIPGDWATRGRMTLYDGKHSMTLYDGKHSLINIDNIPGKETIIDTVREKVL